MLAEVCQAIRARKAVGRVEELGERTPVHKARKAGAQKRIIDSGDLYIYVIDLLMR